MRMPTTKEVIAANERLYRKWLLGGSFVTLLLIACAAAPWLLHNGQLESSSIAPVFSDGTMRYQKTCLYKHFLGAQSVVAGAPRPLSSDAQQDICPPTQDASRR